MNTSPRREKNSIFSCVQYNNYIVTDGMVLLVKFQVHQNINSLAIYQQFFTQFYPKVDRRKYYYQLALIIPTGNGMAL